MIKNKRQYSVILQKLNRLEESLLVLNQNDKLIQEVKELKTISLKGAIQDLKDQMHEFEKLSSQGLTQKIPIPEIDHLGTSLIQVRIAKGITQKALAQKLNMSQQQIQRYERNGYAALSISKLKAFINALGIKLEISDIELVE